MTDRLVKVIQQGKTILRGLKPRGKAVVACQDSNETLDYTVDWSGWLGADTITSVQNAVTGIEISADTNTTTAATFTLSGKSSGYLEHRITTTAGRTKELLFMLEVDGAPIVSDYGYRVRLT